MEYKVEKDGQLGFIFDDEIEQNRFEAYMKLAKNCHYGLDTKEIKPTYEQLEKACLVYLDRINNLEAEQYILRDNINTLTAQLNFARLDNPEQNIEHFRIIKENERKMKNLRYANKDLRQKLNLAKHRLTMANEFIESRKENMIPEHYDDLKYIVNECDLNSSW